jgi:hypothetical protein
MSLDHMIVSLDLQSQRRIGTNRINQRSDRSIAIVGMRLNVRSRPSSRYTLSSPCWQPQSLYRPTHLDLPLEIRSEHLRETRLCVTSRAYASPLVDTGRGTFV